MPGQGSTFYVEFRVTPIQGAAQAQAQQAIARPLAARAATADARWRVLLAEDNAVNQRVWLWACCSIWGTGRRGVGWAGGDAIAVGLV